MDLSAAVHPVDLRRIPSCAGRCGNCHWVVIRAFEQRRHYQAVMFSLPGGFEDQPFRVQRAYSVLAPTPLPVIWYCTSVTAHHIDRSRGLCMAFTCHVPWLHHMGEPMGPGRKRSSHGLPPSRAKGGYSPGTSPDPLSIRLRLGEGRNTTTKPTDQIRAEDSYPVLVRGLLLLLCRLCPRIEE